jgi:hypothetical protein
LNRKAGSQQAVPEAAPNRLVARLHGCLDVERN